MVVRLVQNQNRLFITLLLPHDFLHNTEKEMHEWFTALLFLWWHSGAC